MRKTLIVFGLFFCILAAVFAWRTLLGRSPALSEKNKSSLAAPRPTLPQTESLEKHSYSVSLPQSSFPTSLPLFEFSVGDNLLTFAQSTAKNLGFLEKPSTLVGGRGAFSSWTKGGESLSVGGNPPEISFTTRAAPSLIGSLSGLEEKISEFYKLAGLSSLLIQRVRTNISYFAPKNGLLNKIPSSVGATLVELSYQYSIDEHPVFFRNPSAPSAAFRFNGKGEAVSFSLSWLPGLVKKDGVIPVVPIDEAITQLKSGQGSVVQLFSESDNNEETFQSYKVPAIDIAHTTLGLYAGKGATTLSPVYVFSGQGKDAGSTKVVQTTVVVTALAR